MTPVRVRWAATWCPTLEAWCNVVAYAGSLVQRGGHMHGDSSFRTFFDIIRYDFYKILHTPSNRIMIISIRMRHFFSPYANRGASLVHAHVCRKGGKITGLGVTVLPSRSNNREVCHIKIHIEYFFLITNSTMENKKCI